MSGIVKNPRVPAGAMATLATVTGGVGVGWVHNMGLAAVVWAELYCDIADLGYSAGQTVVLEDVSGTLANAGMVIINGNGSAYLVSGTAVPMIPHYTTGVLTAVTRANWSVRLKGLFL